MINHLQSHTVYQCRATTNSPKQKPKELSRDAQTHDLGREKGRKESWKMDWVPPNVPRGLKMGMVNVATIYGDFGILMNEGFLSHRGTFSSHPFIDGIFPNKNHPAIGVPPILGTPLMVQWISESQSVENSSRRTLLCIKVLAIIAPRRKASGMIIRAFVQPPVIFFGALTRLEKKRTRQFGKNQLWKDTKLTFLTCSLASWLPVRLPMHTWALQRPGPQVGGLGWLHSRSMVIV